ncbi:formyltransferase family protein [Actinokineospora sp.]|uniref:formyltransferase family protein n=1 Tax=Actinokineospora sp. TaxID=1872133 RepID=UPI004037939C
MTRSTPDPLLVGRRGRLRVLALVSATGANLTTLIRLAADHPDLVEVALVASDRPKARALDVAAAAGLRVWPGNFEAECGRYRDCRTDPDRAAYAKRAMAFHDRLADRIEGFERDHGEIDLVVLAYHRWIHGRFLEKFRDRVINQHPGDLASLDDTGARTLIGLDPVGVALRRGDHSTRTSTFLVDDEHDGGPILARGPVVPYGGPRPPSTEDVVRHESLQKELSDRPALRWTVLALAQGRLGIDRSTRHADGSATVRVDGVAAPLGGHVIDQPADHHDPGAKA